jgi:mersacidin/lichenicidin family type 2 lantibiotic
MTNKNKKNQKQPEQQPTAQPIAPATPLELSDEELEQVVGGVSSYQQPPSTGVDGLPSLMFN